MNYGTQPCVWVALSGGGYPERDGRSPRHRTEFGHSSSGHHNQTT